MRKDLTPEAEHQPVLLDYGLQDLQKGPDGGDDLVGWFKVD